MLHGIGKLAFTIFALGALSLCIYALRVVRFTIETEEYPVLLAACQQATLGDREKMLEIVRGAAGKTAIFNFTRGERDDFLRAGGYCLSAAGDSKCKRLPQGVEAQGIAIDIFGHHSCGDMPDGPNICKPTVPGQRC